MASLQDIYIGCTVFSAGVTLLDFLGMLGHENAGGVGDHGSVGDHGGAADVSGADSGGDFDMDMSHTAGDSGVDLDHAGGEVDGDQSGDMDFSHTGHGGVAVLSVLSYLRSFVYFCLGFGPTGWVALGTGRSSAVSFVWALPAGVVALVLARAFFRFQRSDTDSSLHTEDLLFQQATVTVPMTHTKMGKVRIQVGMNVTEQYALAATPGLTFERGDMVRVTNITEDCVHVEDELTVKE